MLEVGCAKPCTCFGDNNYALCAESDSVLIHANIQSCTLRVQCSSMPWVCHVGASSMASKR